MYVYNVYICHMLFNEIEIDFPNYANDTTHYACDLQMEKVIRHSKKMLKSYLNGSILTFYNNFRSEKISSCSSQKLLGILLNFPLTFMLKFFSVRLPRI